MWMPPTIGCRVIKRAASSTATTTTTAFCPCTCSVAINCGSVICVRAGFDGAKHSWAILALLIKRLRQAWPKVEILVRADSGFCRWRMLRWFDRHGVDYVIGIAKNPRLHDQSLALRTLAQWRYWMMGEKQRLFSEVRYAAQTWDTPRRVIVKAEHSARGSNPRFVVTNLTGNAQRIYDRIYCARGRDGEPHQGAAVGPVADRTSCHTWWAISSGCCSQAWLTRCWRRSAGWHYTERHWLARNAARCA